MELKEGFRVRKRCPKARSRVIQCIYLHKDKVQDGLNTIHNTYISERHSITRHRVENWNFEIKFRQKMREKC